MTVKVYTYGLPHGPDELAPVDEQIWRAHRYQNDLIAVERSRRAAYRLRIAEEIPSVAAEDATIASLEEELEVTRAGIRYENANARRRRAGQEDRRTVADCTTALKAARERRKKAVKDGMTPEIKAALKAQDDRSREWAKLLRANCGVYWGTYLLVEDAVKRAAKSKSDPQFRRWGDGEGRVGVQLQGGMTVAELNSGTDTRLRLVVTDTNHTKPRGRLSMRIGSDGRTPVWSHWNVVIHRPLPEEGVIKWAWCQRRKVGTRWRWELQMVVEEPDAMVVHPGGVCAIDVGWRLRDDGLRIGYLVDDESKERELVLPSEIISKIEHPNEIRSVRDKRFDLLKSQLGLWLAAHAEECPAWLVESLRYIDRWRSTARMRKVTCRWGRERFSGDEEIFELVEAWRRKDRHLYQWEASERDRALKRRREAYRLLAKEIAAAYATIIVEDFDLRNMAARPKAEEDDNQHAPARRHRTLAAVSEFRAALEMMAAKHGSTILPVPSPRTTMACHACGKVCAWDAGASLIHACEHCSAEWDQDANAARNLLKIHRGDFQAAAE